MTSIRHPERSREIPLSYPSLSLRDASTLLRYAQNDIMALTDQELLDSLGKAFGPKIQHKTEFRGETTYTIAASDLREIAKFCRDELFVRLPDRYHQHRQFRRRAAFRNCLSSLLDAACSSSAIEIESSGRRRRRRYRFGHLADGELARARNLRHDGNQVQRASRSASHFDVGWLPVLPATKRFSARRIAERNARCRFHQSHADGRRPLRHNSEHCDLKRPRTARTPAGIVDVFTRRWNGCFREKISEVTLILRS